MKYQIITSILVFLCTFTFAQKTLLVEKIGTSRKYYYHLDDEIKLRIRTNDLKVKGRLTSIADSLITVSTAVHSIPLRDIVSVYKRYRFMRKLGIRLGEAAAAYFLIISINNLINKERVLTPYTYIITGSCIAGSLISLSLSQHRCKIGEHWKLKVLDFSVK